MGKNRKAREEIKKSDHDLLKPIDITELGSEDDPCFGKLHDLGAKECKVCGDSDFCQLVKAQNLHKERLDIENKNRFKDIEEAEDEMVEKRKEASKLIEKDKRNIPRLKLIIKVSKKLNLPKDIVKQLYDQI